MDLTGVSVEISSNDEDAESGGTRPISIARQSRDDHSMSRDITSRPSTLTHNFRSSITITASIQPRYFVDQNNITHPAFHYNELSSYYT